MTQAAPPSWSRVKAVLADALELPPEQRARFLDEACGGQAALRARVEELVRAYSASGSLSDADSPAIVPTLMEPAPGQRIGRYRIVRLIGRGGMGAVYEALDEQLSRPVAIKLLSGGAASRSMLRRFELEPRLLARLRHPGIAQIFEAGSISGPDGKPVPFFAMELITGASPITDYARERSLPAPDRIALFVRVCEAVTHGHQRSIIHRDLKPANILVDAGGQPKIIDFGIAHAADPDAVAATVTGEFLGTLRYMSPEQLAGKGEEIDVRVDVYALGVVLYELLSGKPPSPDPESFAASVREAESRVPLALSKINPALSGDIETVALKAVDPERSLRYQSVGEFSADLGRVLRNEPISARPHSAVYQIRMFARRHRALMGALVAISLSLMLGIIGTTAGLIRAQNAQRAAIAQTRRAERISNFLNNTIRSADPQLLPPSTLSTLDAGTNAWESWFVPPAGWGSARAAEVGVAGVLRQAADHLDEEFGDDPALEAEVSTLLAYTLARLEDPRTAARLLESALTTQLRLENPDQDVILRTRSVYAAVLDGLERRDEADIQYREALKIARLRFGAMDPRTLALADMAVVNLGFMADHWDEEVAVARESIRAVADALGPDSAQTWLRHVPLIELLIVRMSPANRAEMVAECRATIAGFERSIGPDALPIAHVAWALAVTIDDDPAALTEAESLLRRAIDIDTKFCGPDSSTVYDARTALGGILLRQKKFDEAEANARESLESALRMMGPHSKYTVKAEGRLARVLTWRQKDAAEAQRLARHAAEAWASEYGPGENFASFHHAIWAAAVRQNGDPATAEAMLRERIALRGNKTPKESAAWVEAYQYLQLALCLADEHRPAEASEVIRTARAWADQMHDPVHPVLLNVIEVQERLGDRPGGG
jgi:serine/threonine protein kinase